MDIHRQNIRNAYFCEPPESIMAEYLRALADPKRRATAKYYRELLDEVLDDFVKDAELQTAKGS